MLILDFGVVLSADGVEAEKGGVFGVRKRAIDDETAGCCCVCWVAVWLAVWFDEGTNDAFAKWKKGDGSGCWWWC